MFKEYPEYKETPAVWIDIIPASWESKKIRELYTERRVKVSDKDYEPLSVCKAGIVPQLEDAVKTDNGDNRRLVKKGDFVINSRSDRKGSSGVSPYDGSVSLICLTLEPITNENGRFMHYLLRSVPFTEEYYRNGHGLVSDLWTTRYDEMQNIFLPIPPISEQNAIVEYLDKKTKQIDEFVSAKEKEIEALNELKKSLITTCSLKGLVENRNMIPSQFPWIGEYPSGWRETRLKNVATKLSHNVLPNADLLICSNSGNVNKRGESKLGLVASSDDIYQGVRKGDLLIHGMDTWHGAIAISDYDGMCTPVVHVCDSHENKRYLAYYLRSLAFLKVYKKITNGVRENTSDFRSWDKAGSINVLIPPISEQNAIVEYLDKKTADVDTMISSIKKQIDLVKELRTKIIADAVTGKVDVREGL